MCFFIQKIRTLSAGCCTGRKIFFCIGMALFVLLPFLAEQTAGNNRIAPVIPQSRGFEEQNIVFLHGLRHSAAALRGNPVQLLQSALRSGRTVQCQSLWRLRAALQTLPSVTQITLSGYNISPVFCGKKFIFQHYLKNSLPVRAGPFCG